MASYSYAKQVANKATTSTVKQPRSMDELRRHARSLYKELIKYSSAHPNQIKKHKYLKQIRADFNRYSQLRDPHKIELLLQKATSRLGYIRMEVPAQLIPLRYRMQNIRDIDQKRTTLSIDSDGKIAASISTLITKARFVNWCDGNNDPDEKRKNDSLIERFHYRGPYWEKRRKGWLPQEAYDLWSGPGFVEALMNKEKYDIGFDLPTPDIAEHPDVKGHMPAIGKRADFGYDNEPDICEMRVKSTKEWDPEAINLSMQTQFNDDQKAKSLGWPTVFEFLRGRRDINSR